MADVPQGASSGPLQGVDVVASDHAARQWTRRGTPSIPIEAAWTAAAAMRLPTPEYREIDEARYHAETGTVLLRQASWLTTVLDATGRESSRSVRRAVQKQFGGPDP